MPLLLKIALYYLAGSAVAGSVMGLGFATNLAGRAGKKQVEALQKIGAYVPMKLEAIEGGLVAAPNERRPTILYIQGRSANRTELLPLAEAMFARGFNAILWDSKSRQIDYGPREVAQIRRILAWAREDPRVEADRIHIVGFSLGGAMAIGAAAEDTDRHIRSIVADSPYADLKEVAHRYVTAFGVIPSPIAWPSKTIAFATAEGLHGIDFNSRNPAEWAARIDCPVLLIHGKSDWRIPPEHSEQIFARLHSRKELWLVDDAGHTESFRWNTNEYIERLVRFFQS